MMNSKRNRGGGRMNSGGRPDKRQMYNQDRPPRRSHNADKNPNVSIEGVYKNQRYTHVVISLVGSLVQVQVKNGCIYEGVFNTYSEKGDVVLDLAHVVDDKAPSKDEVLPKLIVKVSDIVMINAVNVDLDYAVRDTFTDTGISKFNGDVQEKEMRDLTPWEADGGMEINLEEGDKGSNGWDANEMFLTNAQQFNIKSSYDDSLEQYTTKLERRDSAEYRRREEEAEKLAEEIERNPQYMKHIAQENGDGADEEAAFSSVVRPGQSHPPTNSANQKYVPPNRRAGGGNVSKSNRGAYNSHTNRAAAGPPPGHPASVQAPPPHPNQVSSQISTESYNGDEAGRGSIPSSTAGPTVKTSPTSHDHNTTATNTQDKHDPSAVSKLEPGKKKGRDQEIAELKQFSSNFKLNENKDVPAKDRDKDKERVPPNRDSVDNNMTIKDTSVVNVGDSVVNNKDNVVRSESVGKTSDGLGKVMTVTEIERTETSSTVSTLSSHSLEQSPSDESKTRDIKSPGVCPVPSAAAGESSHANTVDAGATTTSQVKSSDIISKSTLNPNAKEFVFAPKPAFQPQQSHTPPRPSTQSPIVQPGQLMNITPQPLYPGQGQPFIMPPGGPMVINQPQPTPTYGVRPKRAVVSVKPDSNTVQAQVQAATGQPLLAAQSAQLPSYMYMNVPPYPQPTGYQVGQVMQMPAVPPGQRGFIPPSSVQGMVPTSMPTGAGAGNMEQNNQSHQTGQAYMSQQGPMPAHITHGQFSHPNHIHVLSNSQNQQQPNQMNPSMQSAGGGVAGHHPAPSPVHSNPNQQTMTPGAHPPSSGTPQPPQGYPQALQPPLQPSPHNNPTSPQNLQAMPYQYSAGGGHHPPVQMVQGSAGGGHQFSVQQQQQQQQSGANVPTSVTYSMQAHPPHLQQIVMMPPYSTASQMSHSHLHSQPFHHMPQGTGPMQPQLMSQSGVQGLPGQGQGQGPHPPHQLHYNIPPVLQGSQHMQGYQASQ